MARVLTVILLLSLLGQTFAQETFSAADLQRDFEFVVQTIQDVHPNPYTKISEAELEQARAHIESQLSEPLTKAAFHTLIESYVESIQDDHTSLLLGDPISEAGCEDTGQRRAYSLNNVGILKLSSFGVDPFNPEPGLDEFATFFEETFEEFQEENISSIIVDLRQNSGGNSDVGDMLVSYITNQPYRMFAQVEAKISTQFLEYFRSTGRELPSEVTSSLGEIFVSEVPLEPPPSNSLRFEGDVFVLTSQCTASSATDFAAVVKDFQLGTIVGEETGGLPTHVGNSLIFTLPETELELRVSSIYYVRPGDFDDGRGVLPDCEVEASQALQAVLSGECQAISP